MKPTGIEANSTIHVNAEKRELGYDVDIVASIATYAVDCIFIFTAVWFAVSMCAEIGLAN